MASALAAMQAERDKQDTIWLTPGVEEKKEAVSTTAFTRANQRPPIKNMPGK